jgi:GTP-sensing pleiotropic transcriptional regulator CodY
MGMYRGRLIAHHNIGKCNRLDSVNINNITYRDVVKYENDLSTVNECSSFIYSIKGGILEYTVKQKNTEVTWKLK